MASFLDVVMPPVLLLVLLLVVAFFVAWISFIQARTSTARRQLYRARRESITSKRAKEAMIAAREVLSEVISEPLSDDELRDKALTAYNLVNQVLYRENNERYGNRAEKRKVSHEE